MDTRFSKRARFLSVLWLGVWAIAYQASAQTPPVLDIQMTAGQAGLTITGPVGTVYSIEYVTELTEPSKSDWRCLEFLQLSTSPYLWTDMSSPATRKRFYRAVVMEAPEDMVFIPPGTFVMGSPEDEAGRWETEGPQTTVTISRGFWMGWHEVTQLEYETVRGYNPSAFPGLPYDPVTAVTWAEAMGYCAALTQRDRSEGRIRSNSLYRLPTEAEWEYACRAGTSTRFSYGDDPDYTELTHYAWFLNNHGHQTSPVAQKLPNPWGLYDMHGNVWEWCLNWWSPTLPGGSVVDPPGPGSGWLRVLRGGAFSSGASDCRSARRVETDPTYKVWNQGFRVVLVPGSP